MEKITNQFHSKETVLYSISNMLERASYYGLRTIMILYLTSGVIKMERLEVYSIYGWFTASFVFSKIFGAILGDLIIGNKKAIIFGAIIQSLGAFILCIPLIEGFYVGLFFVVIGSGLHNSNLISTFGKLYLNKTKLLDAGFTTLNLAVNLGAFIGIASIGYIGEKYGWNFGFTLTGILILLSIIPILFSNETKNKLETEKKLTINKRITKIFIAFGIVALFWVAYELGNIKTFDLQLKFNEVFTSKIPKNLWVSISSILTLFISVFVIILWSFFYTNHIKRLTFGFIFGVLSFGLLFLIPEVPKEQHMIFYLISLFLLNISEIHITPIIYSILTRFSNPKYLAIIISLSIIPTRLFLLLIESFNPLSPNSGLNIGMLIMFIVSLGLVLYLINIRKPTIPSQD